MTKARKKITRLDIIKTLKKHSAVLKKYKVKSIGLFGSYVKYEQTRQSDIDFLIEFNKAAFDSDFTGYFDNFMELQFTLEKLLGNKIDLVTSDMISPYIKPYVLKEVKYV